MTISESFKDKPHIYPVALMIESILFTILAIKFPEEILKAYVLTVQAVIVTCGLPVAAYGTYKWFQKIIKDKREEGM